MYYFSCLPPWRSAVRCVDLIPGKKRNSAMCVGCGGQIHDQFILRVAPDLTWHASCLKCADCDQYLDETCTCFLREGKTYCKRDYIRCERHCFSLVLKLVLQRIVGSSQQVQTRKKIYRLKIERTHVPTLITGTQRYRLTEIVLLFTQLQQGKYGGNFTWVIFLHRQPQAQLPDFNLILNVLDIKHLYKSIQIDSIKIVSLQTSH